MIISHKYKLVFITTPKSGSHTGFKLMEDYFGAAGGFNHSTKIPAGLKDYSSFTFVRNPYERFCALYHACVTNHYKAWVPKSARKTKLSYAKWYASMAKKNCYVRSDLTSSQSYWHKNSRIKNYIQIEKAEEIFDSLYPELNIQMPHELRREHFTWEDVKTDNLIHYINIWAGDDFKLYGYERENINS